jgi:RNA polymerase-binding transcription factor DksA
MNAKRARQRLLDEKARITGAVTVARAASDEAASADPDLSMAPTHPAELAGDITDRETAAAVERTVTLELHRVENALVLLERGEYGRCEICGREIEEERLEVAPTARTCITHRELDARLPDVAG